MCVERGETAGISGESGSGKTTLAKIIAGHLQPVSGEVKINLSNHNKSNPVQLLYQNSAFILNPFRRIFDVVCEASYIQHNDKKTAEHQAENILTMLKINPELWYKRGYELSGGEMQRSALARILAVHPKLLILDEPFAAQDVESQLNMLNIFRTVKTEFDLTLICISHNIRLLKNLADNITMIKNGEIYSVEKSADIKNEN
jgi:peptide/nickel transport system ATP-binding protein